MTNLTQGWFFDRFSFSLTKIEKLAIEYNDLTKIDDKIIVGAGLFRAEFRDTKNETREA